MTARSGLGVVSNMAELLVRSAGWPALRQLPPVIDLNAPGRDFDGGGLCRRDGFGGGIDLGKIKSDEPVSETPKAEEGELSALIALFKATLGDQVKDVRPSERLTDSAVCLIADEGDMDMHLERMLRQHKQLNVSHSRILELNPRHGLIRRLSEKSGEPGATDALADVAWLLLDQARIIEGEPVSDPVAFARRFAALMEKGVG